ncbi:MAG: ABC transporter permease [Deinococcus sp.]|nr:ABC transporter permease [Deinococcus sp.]
MTRLGTTARVVLRHREVGLLVALLLLGALGALLRPDFFLGTQNLFNTARILARVGIIAVGMTFVIVNGDIDLSVGTVTSLLGGVFAVLVKREGWETWYAVLATLGLGAFIGLVNGLLVTKLRIPSFIATLGTLYLALGVNLGLTGAYGIVNFPLSSFYRLGEENPTLGGLPNQVLILLAITAIGGVVLWRTVFGYQVYATGGNRLAARLTGIPTDRVRIIPFVITGFCCAVTGLLGVAFTKTYSVSSGAGTELDVIAAVIVGGASIFGGRGSVLGSLLGGAVLGIIGNLMVIGIRVGDQLVRLPQTWLSIFTGLVILASILFDIWFREEQILARLVAHLRGHRLPARGEGGGGEGAGKGAVSGERRGARSILGQLVSAKEFSVFGGLLFLWLIGVALRPELFLLWDNFLNFIRSLAQIGIMVVGLAYVIINGDLDLSASAVFAATSGLFAVLVKIQGWDAWSAAAVAVGLGTLFGVINGLLVTKLRVPSFIATLGTLNLYRGIAVALAGGFQLVALPPSSFFLIGRDNPDLAKVPNQAIIMAVAALVGGFMLWRSYYGYQVYATGGNWRAARLTGIDVDWVRIQAFILSALCATLAGLINVAYQRSYSVTSGETLGLEAIAAVVIGASLIGGRGSVLGALLGAGVLVVIRMMVLSVFGEIAGDRVILWSAAFVGAAILLAVLIDIWLREEQLISRLVSRFLPHRAHSQELPPPSPPRWAQVLMPTNKTIIALERPHRSYRWPLAAVVVVALGAIAGREILRQHPVVVTESKTYNLIWTKGDAALTLLPNADVLAATDLKNVDPSQNYVFRVDIRLNPGEFLLALYSREPTPSSFITDFIVRTDARSYRRSVDPDGSPRYRGYMVVSSRMVPADKAIEFVYGDDTHILARKRLTLP